MEIHRIKLQKLTNTRDLAGFPAYAGKKVAARRLIRSGELLGASQEDLRQLQEEYDLRRVVDFRTLGEQRERPDPQIKGVAYVSHAILKDETMAVSREEKADQDVLKMLMSQLDNPAFSAQAYMDELYEKLVKDAYSRSQYRKFFEMLLAQEEGAVLWHCTAGKDRTGVGAALVLSAVGTDQQLILQDCMMTNQFAAEAIKRKMDEVEKETGSRKAAEHIGVLFSVRESYLESLLEVIDREFDGMESFLENEMGLSAAARERLLALYTV